MQFFEQIPAECHDYKLDGDITFGMKRFAGERLMPVTYGCIGLPEEKMKPVDEIFLVRVIRCKHCGTPSCYCSKGINCTNEVKERLIQKLNENKGKNIIIHCDSTTIDLQKIWTYTNNKELAKRLYEDYYDKILEKKYATTLYQIENGRFYKISVEHFYRIRGQCICPCCKYRGHTGPRGPCGPTGPGGIEYPYWNVQEYLDKQ